MEINELINVIVNNSVSVALLIYFVYKDNKFSINLEMLLKTLQNSVDSLKETVERGGKSASKRNDKNEG